MSTNHVCQCKQQMGYVNKPKQKVLQKYHIAIVPQNPHLHDQENVIQKWITIQGINN